MPLTEVAGNCKIANRVIVVCARKYLHHHLGFL